MMENKPEYVCWWLAMVGVPRQALAPSLRAAVKQWSKRLRSQKNDVLEDLGGGFKYFLFSSRSLGKISNLTHIFQMGSNHQPEDVFFFKLGEFQVPMVPAVRFLGCRGNFYWKMTIFARKLSDKFPKGLGIFSLPSFPVRQYRWIFHHQKQHPRWLGR